MSVGIAYGLPLGLIAASFMSDSYLAFLAGMICLTIVVCTSRILAAVEASALNPNNRVEY